VLCGFSAYRAVQEPDNLYKKQISTLEDFALGNLVSSCHILIELNKFSQANDCGGNTVIQW
jgi:hypothetical protein